MKFRRKMTTIEAEQYREGKPLPKGVWLTSPDDPPVMACVTTAQGKHVQLLDGDWVVPEPKEYPDRYYPIKNDIFVSTYSRSFDSEEWTCLECKRRDFFPMVMLREEVWLSIAEKKDLLCFDCMEMRLKRPIRTADLKPGQIMENLRLGHWLFCREGLMGEKHLLEVKVRELIDRNAEHRSGIKMGEVLLEQVIAHLREEVDEFEVEAFVPRTVNWEAKRELADILGIVVHLAVRFNVSLVELELLAMAKFKERFKPDPKLSPRGESDGSA